MNPTSRFALAATHLRHRVALTLFCGLAALMSACANFGPAHAPLSATAPAALGLDPSASAPVPSRWWDALNDAQLSALVDQARAGSPTLAVARARLDRASALAEVSRAAGRPQGTLAADVTRQRYTENGLIPPPIAGTVRDNANLQANFSWSPDWFGGHAAEIAASLDQARAAQADVAAASTGLAAQVARSYVALARLVAQRELAQRVLAQRNQAFDLTRQRTSAGLDSQVELTQAEGALPDARTQIEILDEQIALARRQLAVLSGQAPNALDALSPRLQGLRLEDMPVTLGADLLGRRPDLVAARWRVEAATQDIKVAKVQFYPNVNLTAFVGLSALGLGNLFDVGSRQYGVSPALRLPIFDGGRLRAQLGARQAELDAAIAQYNGVLLDAVKEAGDAISSAQSIERQQHDQARALSSAETAYDFALQRFRAGLSGYLVVLNAETQVIAQRRLAVDLRTRAFDTRVALMKALGGGWTDDTTQLDVAAH
ncbi:MAG: efflux transporter outer membrane subunit [Burkholderiaceae bacterium]